MSQRTFACIGSWGFRPVPGGYGITLCEYDEQKGSFSPLCSVLPDVRVGVTIWDSCRDLLYCVDETENLPGPGGRGGGGRVFALKIDREKGTLTELNHQISFAALPSYVCVDLSREHLLVCNHGGGNPATKVSQGADGSWSLDFVFSDAVTVLYPLLPDGAIGEPLDIFRHEPTGERIPRLSHLHSLTMSPDGRFFFVCDKGNDAIYTFTIEQNRLLLQSRYPVHPDSAPRYGLCHPDLPVFYWNHEERTEICAGRYDENGKIVQAKYYDLMADEEDPGLKRQSSDLKMHPNKKYLYNVLRGLNRITVFEILADGSLKKVQTVQFEADTFCGGGARWCAISPECGWLYVAVTDEGDVRRFRLNEEGLILKEEEPFHYGHPANIIFI